MSNNGTTAARAEYPARYYKWQSSFLERSSLSLIEGARVLDVGSGCVPSITPGRRPRGCRYTGMDVSAAELARSSPGYYDETIVVDVGQHLPQLVEHFDLVVSWQVLEHVKPLATALENMRSYLRPGGRFVATLSGRFSLYGLLNQVTPDRLARWAMQRLNGRRPETVFPAYYDSCWYSALERLLAPWSRAEVVPFFIGGTYFSFSETLKGAYLRYEDWIYEKQYINLATHYLIDAIK